MKDKQIPSSYTAIIVVLSAICVLVMALAYVSYTGQAGSLEPYFEPHEE